MTQLIGRVLGLLVLAVSLSGCVPGSVQAEGTEAPAGEPGLWAIRLQPGEAPETAADRLGGVVRGPVGALEQTFVIEVPGGAERAAAIEEQLRAMPEVAWFERQLPRAYYPRPR